jgi:hypothetical protein
LVELAKKVSAIGIKIIKGRKYSLERIIPLKNAQGSRIWVKEIERKCIQPINKLI